MKKLLLALTLLLALCAHALAEDVSVQALTPIAIAPVDFDEPVPLYCGITQGSYRHGEESIRLDQPFVCFGQADCWTMVAQGTPSDFGAVGWIEGGLFIAEDLPELTFEESFSAMIEETAALTNAPMRPDQPWEIALARGAVVTVLAGYGDMLYIQTEIEDTPARVFIPSSSIE